MENHRRAPWQCIEHCRRSSHIITNMQICVLDIDMQWHTKLCPERGRHCGKYHQGTGALELARKRTLAPQRGACRAGAGFMNHIAPDGTMMRRVMHAPRSGRARGHLRKHGFAWSDTHLRPAMCSSVCAGKQRAGRLECRHRIINVFFLYTALGKSRLAGEQDNITVRIHVQVFGIASTCNS